MVLISAPNVMPMAVRVLGFLAAVLFAVTALSAFAGRSLTPLSEPLPFFAYPFLVSPCVAGPGGAAVLGRDLQVA